MFRPTNPSDHHQTMMELQEWERQKDAKTDDFPQITLTKSELLLLTQCYNNQIVPETKQNHNDVLRLHKLNFISVEKPENSENKEVKHCLIRDRGVNYLMYITDKMESERRANKHDWRIAVFSTVAGAILSKPLWSALYWLINCLQAD